MYNAVLYQIDFLSDPAVTDVIVVQVVLQEVSGENLNRNCTRVLSYASLDLGEQCHHSWGQLWMTV